jgi:hypothetical protein
MKTPMSTRPVLVLAAAVLFPVPVFAQDFTVVGLPTQNLNAPVSYYGVRTHVTPAVDPGSLSGLPAPLSSLTATGGGPHNLGAFSIVIVPGATLAGNAAALAAFNRAADAWEALIADPILITINADLAALGPGILGSASSTVLQAGYTTIRDAVVNDAVDEGFDDQIVASLPTSAQFTATVPAGRTITGNLSGSKANLKALGFTGLDAGFGVSDANITFSTGFTFDFDKSNGITAGQFDFEGVAAHEIGHALGFFSEVDATDAGVTSLQANILDLYRFNLASNNPNTPANFTTLPRSLLSGQEAVTDTITTGEFRMSTGVSTGDGRQASHFKDSFGIGLMDPTLAPGELGTLTYADFRAMDLIGYEIIPEPATGVTLLLGAMVLGLRRRRE